MATVFLNGRFLSRDEAFVSAFDAGFQHGVGLFETMTAVVGQVATSPGGQAAKADAEVEALQRVRVIHLPEHMRRLAESARALGLSDALRTAALEEAVSRTAARASMEMPDQAHFRVRLTITGGDLNMLGRGGGGGGGGAAQQPTVLIVAQPATQYPREMSERGVAVTIADMKANPLNAFEGHKTLSYWPRLRELQLAATRGAAEALVFQVSNHLAGGCVSNAFLVKKGVLITPLVRGEEAGSDAAQREQDEAINFGSGEPLPQGPAGGPDTRGALPSPVLPGITRKWVMDWADSELIDVERRMVTIADVLDADEVLLTNSSWGVLPVVRVEREAIGDAVVGEFGRRLVQAWAELVAT